MADPDYRLLDSALATRVARLWPHRECEANFVLGQFCRIELHWWKQLGPAELVPGRDIYFYFWCRKVKIDGVVHEP